MNLMRTIREIFPFICLGLMISAPIAAMPLQAPFIKNQGQFEQQVLYWSTDGQRGVSILSNAIRYEFNDGRVYLHEQVLNPSTSFSVESGVGSWTRVHWYIGQDRNRWQRQIPAHASLRLGSIAEGIALELKQGAAGIEKIFTVAPQASVKAIALGFRESTELTIDDQGLLHVTLVAEKHEAVFNAPVAYQVRNGERDLVEVAYQLLPEGGYGFKVGEYDDELPLVIDPTLIASTLLGGDAQDGIHAIATDADGNLIVTGATHVPSPTQTEPFPIKSGGYDTTLPTGIGYDNFLVRFDPNLERMLDMTFLGSTASDWPTGLVIDKDDSIIIVGTTESADGFPTTEGAYQSGGVRYSGRGGFISRFSSDLSTLLASTGFYSEAGYRNIWTNALAVDSTGNIFICGMTDGSGLPGEGYDQNHHGWGDAFLAKFDASLSNLIASTYLGGSADDDCYALAVNEAGQIFATGPTKPASIPPSYALVYDFPTTSGTWIPQGTGCEASFVARLDNNLNHLEASSFIAVTGSSQSHCGYSTSYGHLTTRDLLLGPKNRLYIAGDLDSSGLPITGGVQSLFPQVHSSHNRAPFVLAMDQDLATVEVATYFGGATWFDYGRKLAVNSKGEIVLGGSAGSTDFPTTIDAYNRKLNLGVGGNSAYDAFVSVFSTDLTELRYSTVIGGAKNDVFSSLAVAADDTLYIGGKTAGTWSSEANFPTTDASFDNILPDWGLDGFVARMEVPEILSIEIAGAGRMVPGAEEQFELTYRNSMSVTAQDAVVLVDIPAGFAFSGHDGAAQFYAAGRCENRLFWSLGNLPANSEGKLYFKMAVPAGAPEAHFELTARISAANDPEDTFDVTPYLDYEGVDIAQWRFLTLDEAQAVRESDPSVSALYDGALAKGYAFSGTATEVDMTDGTTIHQFYLVDISDGTIAVLTGTAAGAVIERHQGNVISVFDLDGGFAWDRALGSIDYFDGVPSSVQSRHQRTEATASLLSDEKICRFNCMIVSFPDIALSKMTAGYDLASLSIDCIKCGEAARSGNTDEVSIRTNCSKCGTNVAVKALKLAPGIGEIVHMATSLVDCIDACADNPNSHICIPGTERYDCSCLMNWFDSQRVCITRCDQKGSYAPYAPAVGCGNSPDNGDKLYCNAASCDQSRGWESCCQPKSAMCNPNSQACATQTTQVQAAHDPNAKLATPDGAVLAGSTIDYILQYENVGAGDALGVFVIDRLSTLYDESSLSIQDGGTYDDNSRLLYWDIGDLGPGEQGEVRFSVKIDADLAPGTEVSNQAKVYFPSALEVTPTNLIVHQITDLAAHDQHLQVTAGDPEPITLTGQGPAGFSYEILAGPLFGTLTGTPPQMSYTAESGYSGVDEIQFRVLSGNRASAPATIAIDVAPDPADTTPPTVRSVSPRDGQTGVPVGLEAIREGAYAPAIDAVFSEPIDSRGVSFGIDGIAGEVEYHAATQTLRYWPGQALAYEQLYNVTLDGAVDLNGNPMQEAFTWSFTTAQFEPDPYMIQTSASPSAGGTVNCTPNPVDHGGSSVCNAAANTGYNFSNWSGDCQGTNSSCTLSNVTSTKDVTAVFTPKTYAIQTIASPSTSGTVSCAPNPVDHGANSTCTATANTGYTFGSWSGDCSGTHPSCTLSKVTNIRRVTAYFVITGGECHTGALRLTDRIISGYEDHRSEVSIQVAGTVTVANGAALYLNAPRVAFEPGFRVAAGARLSAVAGSVSCVAP